MVQENFIPINREVKKHWIYQRPEYFITWFEMLSCAKYTIESEQKLIYGVLTNLDYGEFVFGLPSWCERLHVPEQVMKTLVKKMISSNMIVLKKKHSKFTIYKIVNFKKFNQHTNQHQSIETSEGEEYCNHQNNQQLTSNQPATNQQLTTNKKLKKEKKVIYISSNEDIVSAADKIPYKEIIELFNSICTTLPQAKDITGNRQNTLRIMWKEYKSIDYFKELFIKTHESDFLTGRNGKWMNCNFDWIIKPDNRKKIIEGVYKNKEPQVINANKKEFSNMGNFDQRIYGEEYYNEFFSNSKKSKDKSI